MQGRRHSGRRESSAALKVGVEGAERAVVSRRRRFRSAVRGRHDTAGGRSRRRAEVAGGRGEVATGAAVHRRGVSAAAGRRNAVGGVRQR